MSLSEEEIKQLLYEATEKIREITSDSEWSEGKIASELFPNLYTKWDYLDDLYTPDDKLISRINDYNQWCLSKTGEDPGQLMEEIAFLAFRCLKGYQSIQSFQSYAPQHDLVISGNDGSWSLLMDYLHLPQSGRTIVLEAKNLDDDVKVDDKQFARLCGIIDNKFASTCHLGIFVTRNGATGFSFTRVLRDARATQILFHSKTDKFVVVLEHDDLQKLIQQGALPKILEAKIRDVENASNAPLEIDETGDNWVEIKLPEHLAKYLGAT
jgi:hypothetical protein